MKLLILAMLIGIVGSLGSALYFLAQDKGESGKTLRALTWRIGLSVTLFGMLFVLYWLGLIHPHPL